jgi:ribonucleoside-diphosphate reductase alpha chain
MKSKYEILSEERKAMQAEGNMPQWWATASWQLFKEKYLYGTDTVRGQYERIARTAAKYLPEDMREKAYDIFFEMLWDGILSCSTPVLSNAGTNRGLVVSCQGEWLGDSIDEFYMARHSLAMHTKKGFGTSGYLGSVRARGSNISIGGKSEGVLPLITGIRDDMKYVSQGNTRRGSFAGYLPISHGDFHEVADYVYANPEDINIGWNVYDNDVEALDNGDQEMIRRYQKTMRTKMTYGKGYFMFPDKANRLAPPAIRRYAEDAIKASNLCTEIMLPQDEDYNFVCVLSSLNLIHWDKIKSGNYVFWATIFLDCINQDFIENARGVPGLKKSVKAAEDFRALGLGVLGFHSLLQSKMIPFETFDAHILNKEIFQFINQQSLEASQFMAKILGEPLRCAGLGVRNAARMAVAPTKSTAAIMGGVSEGINPDASMVYTQSTPAGEVNRINPYLLTLMKERGKFTQKRVDAIASRGGSVQAEDWLTDHEKTVFKTAFELNMEAQIRLCAARQPDIDQGQSMNLFYAGDVPAETISRHHRAIFRNPNIKSAYYIYSTRLAAGASEVCEACQ